MSLSKRKPTQINATKQLQKLISEKRSYIIPCVFDALSSRIVEKSSFPILFISGGSLAATMGLPDLELVTLPEVSAKMREITACTTKPVVVDSDTGYGGLLNVQRAAKEFYQAGVAGMMLQDEISPKLTKRGSDSGIVDPDEMIAMIETAKHAVPDENFVIVGRTDALVSEGIDATIERAQKYADAGAGLIFIHGVRNYADFRKARERLDQPQIAVPSQANNDAVSAEDLKTLGYEFIVFPGLLIQVITYAMKEAIDDLELNHSTANLRGRMSSLAEINELLDENEVFESVKQFVRW